MMRSRLRSLARERLFGALPVVDVDVQGIPAHDAPVGVAEGQSANLKPTIRSVSAAKSLFGVIRRPCGGRMQGRVEDVLKILWMNEVGDPPTFQLLRRSSRST